MIANELGSTLTVLADALRRLSSLSSNHPSASSSSSSSRVAWTTEFQGELELLLHNCIESLQSFIQSPPETVAQLQLFPGSISHINGRCTANNSGVAAIGTLGAPNLSLHDRDARRKLQTARSILESLRLDACALWNVVEDISSSSPSSSSSSPSSSNSNFESFILQCRCLASDAICLSLCGPSNINREAALGGAVAALDAAWMFRQTSSQIVKHFARSGAAGGSDAVADIVVALLNSAGYFAAQVWKLATSSASAFTALRSSMSPVAIEKLLVIAADAQVFAIEGRVSLVLVAVRGAAAGRVDEALDLKPLQQLPEFFTSTLKTLDQRFSNSSSSSSSTVASFVTRVAEIAIDFTNQILNPQSPTATPVVQNLTLLLLNAISSAIDRHVVSTSEPSRNTSNANEQQFLAAHVSFRRAQLHRSLGDHATALTVSTAAEVSLSQCVPSTARLGAINNSGGAFAGVQPSEVHRLRTLILLLRFDVYITLAAASSQTGPSGQDAAESISLISHPSKHAMLENAVSVVRSLLALHGEVSNTTRVDPHHPQEQQQRLTLASFIFDRVIASCEVVCKALVETNASMSSSSSSSSTSTTSLLLDSLKILLSLAESGGATTARVRGDGSSTCSSTLDPARFRLQLTVARWFGELTMRSAEFTTRAALDRGQECLRFLQHVVDEDRAAVGLSASNDEAAVADLLEHIDNADAAPTRASSPSDPLQQQQQQHKQQLGGRAELLEHWEECFIVLWPVAQHLLKLHAEATTAIVAQDQQTLINDCVISCMALAAAVSQGCGLHQRCVALRALARAHVLVQGDTTAARKVLAAASRLMPRSAHTALLLFQLDISEVPIDASSTSSSPTSERLSVSLNDMAAADRRDDAVEALSIAAQLARDRGMSAVCAIALKHLVNDRIEHDGSDSTSALSLLRAWAACKSATQSSPTKNRDLAEWVWCAGVVRHLLSSCTAGDAAEHLFWSTTLLERVPSEMEPRGNIEQERQLCSAVLHIATAGVSNIAQANDKAAESLDALENRIRVAGAAFLARCQMPDEERSDIVQPCLDALRAIKQSLYRSAATGGTDKPSNENVELWRTVIATEIVCVVQQQQHQQQQSDCVDDDHATMPETVSDVECRVLQLVAELQDKCRGSVGISPGFTRSETAARCSDDGAAATTQLTSQDGAVLPLSKDMDDPIVEKAGSSFDSARERCAVSLQLAQFCSSGRLHQCSKVLLQDALESCQGFFESASTIHSATTFELASTLASFAESLHVGLECICPTRAAQLELSSATTTELSRASEQLLDAYCKNTSNFCADGASNTKRAGGLVEVSLVTSLQWTLRAIICELWNAAVFDVNVGDIDRAVAFVRNLRRCAQALRRILKLSKMVSKEEHIAVNDVANESGNAAAGLVEVLLAQFQAATGVVVAD